ncbi:MAG TPA: VOC family protein [Nitrospiria bacterium]|jgi:catechol 2,3-dioxygenase-like lactoylglutathione lyase family enzyme|nr:VOC family protein [Nitrospiria bacterium]
MDKHDHIPLQGLRHLAIRVTDIQKARDFYQGLLGMKTVWEPDPENVYLSSGQDNLALHQIPNAELARYHQGIGQFMDHFGFLVENPEEVEEVFKKMETAGVRIIKPVKRHRDGSISFYMTDPDKNVIQILYEPTISGI